MDKLNFWKQKIAHALHDPPAKPYYAYPGTGGHKKGAINLLTRFTGQIFKYLPGVGDYVAAGADRPFVSPPRKRMGVKPIQIRWPSRPVLTHPLAPGASFDVNYGSPLDEATAGAKERYEFMGEQAEAIENLADPLLDWNDAEELRRNSTILWRRLRDDLLQANPTGARNLAWQEMPADSRCPDHSIWDHLKVTSALAFLDRKARDGDAEYPQSPWLFRFEIGPVQRFIEEARTSRDLWIGSFLLADLIREAMLPILDRYGPDCIVYPDLRGNPLIDGWLAGAVPGALPEIALNSPEEVPSSSFAAVLPSSFTAILPRGGAGHLAKLEDLAAEAQASLQGRWKQHADLVRDWLRKRVGPGPWEAIWERQHRQVLSATWTAVAWLPAERFDDCRSLAGPGLPAQREPDYRPSQQDLEAREKREARLRPYVPDEVWAHYQWAYGVYAATNPDLLRMERGFDYALTHHQLRVRHALRKQTAAEPMIAGESGEKCSLCGRRQALTNADADLPLHGARRAARKFWENDVLNPEPGKIERLCGVCAMKRFLVEAGADRESGKLAGINPNWAGPDVPLKDVSDKDGEVRVPFPSTATLAAQDYLASVCGNERFHSHLARVAEAYQATGLPRTSFPRALSRLAYLAETGTKPVQRFLMLDTQQSLFPQTLDALIRQAEREKKPVEQARYQAHPITHIFLRLVNQWLACHVKVPIRGDDPLPQVGNQALGSARLAGFPQTKDLWVMGCYQALRKAVAGLRREVRRVAEEENKERRRKDLPLRPAEPGTRIAVVRLDGDRMGRLLLGDGDAIPATWKDVIHPSAVEQMRINEHTVKAGWPDLLDAHRLMGPSLHAYISRALAAFSHQVVPWVVEQEFGGRLVYAGGDDVLCLAPADQALALAARLQQLFSAAWIVDTRPEADPWVWRRKGQSRPHDPEGARARFAIPRTDRGEPVQLPLTDPDKAEKHVLCLMDDDTPAVRLPVPFRAEGRLLPMLGKGQSLSAGIAYGHYKTSLAGLLRQSKAMLETWAKDRAGRRAVGLSHFSRGGLKTEFALPWERDGISAYERFEMVRRGFDCGNLPGRLPYKLRELNPVLRPLLTGETPVNDESRAALLRGMFEQCLGAGTAGKAEADHAFLLWRQGLELALAKAQGETPNKCGSEQSDPLARAADGLVLARLLAQSGEEEP